MSNASEPSFKKAEVLAQLEVLQRFNRKVERLERSGFCRRYENELPNVVARFQDVKIRDVGDGSFEVFGRIHSVLEDFDQDEIDAFVLTYRIFTQNNDQLSIGSLSRIYQSAWMPEGASECFVDARRELNDYLEGAATIHFGDQQVSVKAIVEVVLYGALAHSNPKKAEIFEAWERSGMMGFIWAEFFAYGCFAVRILRYLRDLNASLMAFLETEPELSSVEAPSG